MRNEELPFRARMREPLSCDALIAFYEREERRERRNRMAARIFVSALGWLGLAGVVVLGILQAIKWFR